MSTMHPSERLLPSPAALDLLDAILASYLSELEAVTASVRRETDAVPFDEYEQLAAAGCGDLGGRRFDEADLLELVRFTAEGLRAAEALRARMTELQTLALAAMHEQRDFAGVDDPAWVAHRQRVAGYHGAQLARYDCERS